MTNFDNLLNFRDVGQNINDISHSNSLKTGILFRSARPDEASLHDRSRLVNQYHVKTIIDLRSQTELINAAKKHTDAVSIAQSAAIPEPDSMVTKPFKISGIEYRRINLNGKGFERALIWKMKYVSLAKLVTLMALGYRTEGIAVLGKEIMQPRGLIGLGLDTLDHSGPELKQVFDVLADRNKYPLMIHCTQGKDRTGLVVFLALLLSGIDIPAISEDYVLSEKELEPEMEERMKEIKSIGLDESFAKCPTDFASRMKEHLDENYGGLESYLTKIGVDTSQQRVTRAILTNNSKTTHH